MLIIEQRDKTKYINVRNKARNSVVKMDYSRVIDDCLSAFKNKDYDEAVRLLPLAADKAKKSQSQRERSQKSALSPYTIKISSIDHWYNDDLEAGLLHLSSRNGWLDVTKELIEQYKLDPRVGDNEGNTCLHYAAAGNQLEVMRYLNSRGQLHGELHSVSNKYGASPLHTAAANGSLDVMKYPIEHYHWNTKQTDYKGRTVLHYGAKHIDIVKYLITKCNCDPMVTDKDGKTVLHCAVELNQLDVAEYLLSTGKCDPVAKDNKKRTPLQLTDISECEPTTEAQLCELYAFIVYCMGLLKALLIHVTHQKKRKLVGYYHNFPEFYCS